jgi:hypothetical protein
VDLRGENEDCVGEFLRGEDGAEGGRGVLEGEM